MNQYEVIGIMSGSSMDGVDIAHCVFTNNNNQWSYKITHAVTVPYEEKWRVRLSQLRKQESLIYVKTDVYYAHYLSELVLDFIQTNNLKPQLIASHGHTIFHFPQNRITAQVGDGATLAALTGIPVVSDLRSADVALGGQGAPLVAMGDQMLFAEYDYFLNLGGFSNISGPNMQGDYVAFDVGPCNIPLNRIAREQGKAYDEMGVIAASGSIDYGLLNNLNQIPYYSKSYPKSLNRDWINKNFWPIVRESEQTWENKMRTIVDHIAQQVGLAISNLCVDNGTGKKVMVTGGSAYNPILLDHIQTHSDAEIIVPQPQLIDYKEAMVFGFLGLLRVLNINNTLATATGASQSVISGTLSGNFSHLL